MSDSELSEDDVAYVESDDSPAADIWKYRRQSRQRQPSPKSAEKSNSMQRYSLLQLKPVFRQVD